MSQLFYIIIRYYECFLSIIKNISNKNILNIETLRVFHVNVKRQKHKKE